MADPVLSHPDSNTDDLAAEGLRFLKAHYPQLAAGLAVVLVVAIGLTLFGLQQRRQDERASQMLLMAESRQQWEEFLKQNPRGDVTPIGRLALAASQYEAGDYDGAAATYALFLDKSPKHPMALAAVLGRVQCREARGESEAALKDYEQFGSEHPDHFLAPQALFGKARCLQKLGRAAEAKAMYEDYIAAHPKSEWAAQAEFALRSVDRELRAKRAAPAGAR